MNNNTGYLSIFSNTGILRISLVLILTTCLVLTIFVRVVQASIPMDDWNLINPLPGDNDRSIGYVENQQISLDAPTVPDASAFRDTSPSAATNQVIYVSESGLSSGICDTWVNACELRYALANAVLGQEIWVQTGTYAPASGSDRVATFQLLNGVEIYGGFIGIENNRTERDPIANVTILSGDLNGDDGADFANNDENSYHVVTGSGTDATAILDGFTISNGNADGASPHFYGGGMYINTGNPTLTNITFSQNYAGGGGGLYNKDGSPILTNIIFSNNTVDFGNSTAEGGGMRNEFGSPTLTNITFQNNTADSGGGMYNGNGSPTLTKVTFKENSGGYGGGMNNWCAYVLCYPLLTNVTIANNTAHTGGAIHNGSDVMMTLTNVTIRDNYASNHSGGIDNSYSDIVLQNSILWGNSSAHDETGRGQVFDWFSTSTISNSIVQDGCPASSDCSFVSTEDPLLGELSDFGGTTETIPLLPGSPAIDATSSNCPATDQRGQLRSTPSCDLGAFESSGFILNITAGNNQITAKSTAFTDDLSVNVSPITPGEAVDGGKIIFTAPGSGPSASISGSPATISGGAATVSATANNLLGEYQISASTIGASSISFSATNSINISADDGVSIEHVNITWEDVGENYEIWRGTTLNPAEAAVIEYIDSVSPTSYNDTSAVPGVLYYYWVNVCSSGDCLFSIPNPGYRSLAIPTSVEASDGTSLDHIAISWDTVSDATHYEVWRGGSSNFASATLLESPSSEFHNDASAIAGEKYYYWIKACGPDRCGERSSSDTGYKLLATPSSVAASNGTSTDQIAISWGVIEFATYYEVWRGTPTLALIASPVSAVYSDTNATPGIMYSYGIKACGNGGCSNISDSDTGFRAVSPPAQIAASDGTSTTSIQISWDASDGATSYQIWSSTNSNSASASLLSSLPSTSYSDYDNQPGVTNYYWIKACASTGCSEFSNSDSGFRSYPSPSISASDGSSTQIVAVTWSNITGATSYQVWRNTNSNAASATLLASPLTTNYNDSSAIPGVQYYYWGKTCTSAGCGVFSSYNSGYRALSPPTNLSASDGTSNTQIEISWNTSNGATFYQVWRNTSSNAGGAALISSPTLSAYTEDSAQPGVTYYYWIKACTNLTCSDFSNVDSGYRILLAPNNFSASDGISTANVSLTWNSVSGATSYQVWRGTTANPTLAHVISTPISTSYLDSNAQAGVAYYYWVKACRDTCSDFSDFDTGYRALPAPVNLSASDGTSTEYVLVSWSSVSGGTYYEVWRNTSSNSGGATLISSPTSANFMDTSTTPGIQYYYWVTTCTNAGCGGFGSYNTGFRALSPPGNLSASDGTSTNNIETAWDASNGATFYHIWRGTNSNSAAASQISSQTTITLIDTGATTGVLYYYWLKACTNLSCSEFSDFNTGYRAFNAPTSISASDGTSMDYVAVSWSSVSNATFYQIWRGTTYDPAESTQIDSAVSTSYNDTSAIHGIQYFYRIKACNSVGCSELSTVTNSGYRALLTPDNLSASDGTSPDFIAISWDTVSGATSYQVWRGTSNSVASASRISTITDTSYDDTDTISVSQYFYWIKACSDLTCSEFSNSEGGWRLNKVIYSRPGGLLNGQCENWGNACELYFALNNAIAGQEIWAQFGIYKPDSGTNRNATFQLKNEVSIFGGFEGTETVLEERNPDTHITTLSGDLNGNDGAGFTNYIENSYHVVTSSGTDSSAILDGFTIRGGYANGTNPNDSGAGIYASSGSPSLTHLRIYENWAIYGGGMAIEDSNPLLTNITFSGNRANLGGGLINKNGASTLTNILFKDNTTIEGGHGSGIYNLQGNLSLTNVTFSNNSTSGNGGGMWNENASPTLTNVTFFNNSALQGGGLYNIAGSTAIIQNTILWGNSANQGSQIYDNNSTPIVRNCVIEGGYSGTNIITTDPRLGGLGIYGGATETIPLLHDSSAIDATDSNCPSTDQRGENRSIPICDIGAYEFSSEIDVIGNEKSIVTGDLTPSSADDTDFGATVTDGGLVRHTFTFQSNSWDAVVLSGTPAISLTNGTVFTVTQPISKTLTQDEITTFQITFDPDSVGTFSDTVRITNNDSDESPYTFVISGTGVAGTQTSLALNVEASLTYTDTNNNTTTVQVPANAVVEEVNLVYQPVPSIDEASTGFSFAGCAFELDVFINDNKQDDFNFSEAINITLNYTDENITGMNEANLKLLFWDGDEWQDAACGLIEHNLDENWIKVPICHLTEFGLFDRTYKVYIPLVIR